MVKGLVDVWPRPRGHARCMAPLEFHQGRFAINLGQTGLGGAGQSSQVFFTLGTVEMALDDDAAARCQDDGGHVPQQGEAQPSRLCPSELRQPVMQDLLVLVLGDQRQVKGVGQMGAQVGLPGRGKPGNHKEQWGRRSLGRRLPVDETHRITVEAAFRAVMLRKVRGRPLQSNTPRTVWQ